MFYINIFLFYIIINEYFTSHLLNGTEYISNSPMYTIAIAPCIDIQIAPNHEAKRPTTLAPINYKYRKYRI